MRKLFQLLLILLTLGVIYFFFFAETNQMTIPLAILLILVALFYQIKYLRKNEPH